jgi:hypothetical protein
MKQKLLYIVCVLAILASFILPFATPVAYATTTSFSSTTGDGYFNPDVINSTPYATVWADTAQGAPSTTGSVVLVGQLPWATDTFQIYRGFLYFDTSSIPDGATITSANIKLYATTSDSYYNQNPTGYSIYVQSGMPTYPHSPAVAADYNKANYNSTVVGAFAAGSWSNNNYWNIVPIYQASLSTINKTGTTKYVLRSSMDYNGTTPGTYWECLRFRSADSGYAPVLEVTYTSISAPTVTTSAASSIAQTSATLNGSLTSLGGDTYTNVRFNYGLTTALGTSTSWVAKSATGTFSAGISSLTAGTTYYFQAEGDNSYATNGYGQTLEFTTLSSITAPTVVTYGSDSVLETSMRLIGYLSDDGGQTCSVRFEYGLTGSYGSYTSWQSGFTEGNYFYATISGLNKGDLYYFKAVATSSGGTGNGAQDTELTYPSAPTNFTVSPTAAQNALAWSKTSDVQQTLIRHSTTTYPQNTSDGTQTYFNTGTSYSHGSLTNGLTYYYTVWGYATEGGLTKYSYNAVSGYGMPFATTTATVTTLAATTVGTTSATLNGRLSNLGGYATVDVSFQWYTGGGTWTDHVTTPVTKSATCDFNEPLTGLAAATLHHFRVKATNGAGTVYGADTTFTTGGYSAPTMTTGAASDLTKTTAKLNGTVTTDGGASVTGYFEWGLTTSYGSTSTTVAGLTTGSTMYLNLSELTPGTTYHYRVVGTNSAGTAYGSDVSFVTIAPDLPTVITNAATQVGANSAILNGLLQTDGSSTCEVQFQWFEQGGSWTTATSTGWQTGKISGNAFTFSLGGLTMGKTYYFRAQAKNTTGTASGATQYFATTFTAPTNFDATALTSISVRLTWTKGGDQTYIVMGDGYPTSRTDGVMVYFGVDSTFIVSSNLVAGKTYYFSAWSWREGDIFSSTYSTALATTPASQQGTEGELPSGEVAPHKPSGWFAAPDYERMSGFPLYGFVNNYADSISMPRGTFWLLQVIVLSIILGIITFFLVGRSFTAGIIVITMTLLLGFLAGLVPLWLVIVVGIFCISVVILKQ